MASKTFSGVKGRVLIGQDAPDWTASTDYGINDLVQPTTANDMVYRCKTPGTSDASEPSWSTTEGTEITDGTVTWVAMPYIVAKMNQQDLNLQGSEIDTSGFEDEWGTTDTTDNKWSGSFQGFAVESSTTQDYLESCWAEKSIIKYIRFYLKYVESPNSADPAVYRTPDIASYEAAGVRISSIATGIARNNVGTFNVNFSGSGPLKKVTQTS